MSSNIDINMEYAQFQVLESAFQLSDDLQSIQATTARSYLSVLCSTLFYPDLQDGADTIKSLKNYSNHCWWSEIYTTVEYRICDRWLFQYLIKSPIKLVLRHSKLR
jgi:hypothetical protein